MAGVRIDLPGRRAAVLRRCRHRLGDPATIDHYGIDGLRVGHREVYDVAANWKLIVENFMECYHRASIHPELVGVLAEFSRGLAAQYYVGHAPSSAPISPGSALTAQLDSTTCPASPSNRTAAGGVDVPLEDIARRAGVSIGTLYNHFSNRGALLDAVLPERLAELDGLAGAALADPDPWGGFYRLPRRHVRHAGP